MATNFAVVYPQVRVLKKVRRQFLHKTPDLTQEQNENQNILQQVNNDTHTIQPSLGFFEKGKKLFVAAEFVNLHFNITKTLIEKRPQSRIVTLDVSPKEHDSRIPLEEAVKRLESYGDLECATWAHRIRNHQASYRKAMANYYEIMKSRDPQIQANYRKVQQKAVLTCREIERTYPFQKYVQFLKKDTHQLASCSYSEDFLKEMGFTPESFILWTQSNGIPKIFETNNDLYYNIIKAFYSFVPILTQPVIEGGEIETNLYDKENRLRRVKVRFINVLEPRADMPLNHCYLIINKEKLDAPQETIRQKRVEIKETDSPTKTEGMNTPGDIKNVTAIP